MNAFTQKTLNGTTSKKKNSHNDFNSFRIEALEPRLLQQVANLSARQCQKASFLSLRSPCMVVMSASPTAADWLLEFSSVESVVSGVESGLSSTAVTNELNHDVNCIAA